jgi:hypothetical protein
MEMKVLKVLDYQLGTCTIYEFLTRFSLVAKLDERETLFAQVING